MGWRAGVTPSAFSKKMANNEGVFFDSYACIAIFRKIAKWWRRVVR